MPPRPDFTRKAVPPVAPAIPKTDHPLPTGQVMMTPETRKQMEAMGWKDGDPIPTNLAQKVAEVQARYREEMETAQLPLPPDHKPPRVKLVDIATLPPAAQEELRGFIAEAREMQAQMQAQESAEAQIDAQIPEGASPGVVEAIRASARAAQLAQVNQAIGPTATVAPLRTPQAPAPAPPQAPVPPAPQAPAPPAPAAPADAPSGSATATIPQLCPRCQWDMNLIFDVAPTATDRENFVAAVLAQSRFRKTVELFGGTLKATFRSLTSREAELLFSQLRADMRSEAIITDADYFMKMQIYRLVMGLEKVVSQDQVMTQVPEIFSVPYDPQQSGGKTLLENMVEWFWSDAVPQESLRRLLASQHRAFQRLVETLEAQTSEPDFWKGIGPRA